MITMGDVDPIVEHVTAWLYHVPFRGRFVRLGVRYSVALDEPVSAVAYVDQDQIVLPRVGWYAEFGDDLARQIVILSKQTVAAWMVSQ